MSKLLSWLTGRRRDTAPSQNRPPAAVLHGYPDEDHVGEVPLRNLQFALGVLNPGFTVPPEISDGVSEALADESNVTAWLLFGRLNNRAIFIVGLDFPATPELGEGWGVMTRVTSAVKRKRTGVNIGVIMMNEMTKGMTSFAGRKLYPPHPPDSEGVPRQSTDRPFYESPEHTVTTIQMKEKSIEPPFDFVMI